MHCVLFLVPNTNSLYVRIRNSLMYGTHTEIQWLLYKGFKKEERDTEVLDLPDLRIVIKKGCKWAGLLLGIRYIPERLALNKGNALSHLIGLSGEGARTMALGIRPLGWDKLLLYLKLGFIIAQHYRVGRLSAQYDPIPFFVCSDSSCLAKTALSLS